MKRTSEEHVPSQNGNCKRARIDSQRVTARGQVVRLTMRRFMTYENATIFPGPHMNLVVGPNGTGKSTVVCALYVGFMGNTKKLGRAESVQSMVKRGHMDSEIEIELALGNGKTMLIRRCTRSDKAPLDDNIPVDVVYVNEQRKTVGATRNMLKDDFGITVENLCQFLPQERVKEFAGLKPEVLLEKCQRSVLGEESFQKQKRLKEMQGNGGEMQRKYRKFKSLVEEHEREVERREEEVKEYEKLEERKVELRNLRVFTAYERASEARDRREKAKKDHTEKAKAYGELEAKLKKVDAPVKKLKDRMVAVESEVRKANTDCYKKEEKSKELFAEASRYADFERDIVDDMEKAQEDQKKRIEKKKQIEARIKEVETKIANNDTIDHSAKIKKMRRRANEIGQKMDKAHDDQDRAVFTIQKSRRDLQNCERILKSADNTSQLIMQAIAGTVYSQNRQAAIKRVREKILEDRRSVASGGRSIFVGQVYGPIGAEIKVDGDDRNKDIVEDAVGVGLMRNFVTQNAQDQKTLLELGEVDVICIDQSVRTGNPMSIEEARRYGVEAFVDHLFSAPDLVKMALCNWAAVNTVALAVDGKIDYETLMRDNMDIKKVFTEGQLFTGRISAYTQNMSINSRGIRESRLLRVNNGNDEDVSETRAQATHLKKQMEEAEAQKREAVALQSELANQGHAIKEQLELLENEMNGTAGLQRSLNRLTKDLRKVEVELEIKSPEALLKEALAGLAKNRKQRDQAIDRCHKYLESAANDRMSLDEKVIESHGLQHEFEVKTRASRQLRDKLKKAKIELDEADRVRDVTVRAYNERKDEMKEALNKHYPNMEQKAAQSENIKWALEKKYIEMQTVKQEGGSKTASAKRVRNIDFVNLDAMIEELAAEIERTHVEERAPELLEMARGRLEETREEVKKLEEQLMNRDAEVERLRAEWSAEVVELVKKINDNFSKIFSRMGYIGEVRLVIDAADVAASQIQLWVKYHNDQPLRKLMSGSQSGGEQAVATAAFLMALQSLDRAPFRLVDEINQGMDSKNELKVWTQMIRMSDPEQMSMEDDPLLAADGNPTTETAQYFIITPKLLSNLDYGTRCAVHVIFNGPRTPKPTDWFNVYRPRIPSSCMTPNEGGAGRPPRSS